MVYIISHDNNKHSLNNKRCSMVKKQNLAYLHDHVWGTIEGFPGTIYFLMNTLSRENLFHRATCEARDI